MQVPLKTKSVCVNSAVGLSVLVQEDTQVVTPLQEKEKQLTCGTVASAANKVCCISLALAPIFLMWTFSIHTSSRSP